MDKAEPHLYRCGTACHFRIFQRNFSGFLPTNDEQDASINPMSRRDVLAAGWSQMALLRRKDTKKCGTCKKIRKFFHTFPLSVFKRKSFRQNQRDEKAGTSCIGVENLPCRIPRFSLSHKVFQACA